MPTRCSGILRPLACLGSGALLSLAFAPVAFGPIVWIALLPMLAVLWTVEGKRAGWKGFGLGWLAGFAFFALNLKWLNTVSWVGALVLPAYLALFFGAFGSFAATWGNGIRNGRGRAGVVFANAAVWAGLEWLRGWLLTGFGWNGLGVALHGSAWLAQGADLFGVTGLSGVVMAGNLLLLLATRRVLRRRSPWREAMAAITLLAALSIYGAVRLASVGHGESVTLRALLVQINAPQEAARWLWEPERIHMAYEEETGKALETLRAKGVTPDWVIWPESALAGRLLRMDDGAWAMWQENLNTIERVRQEEKFTLMMGLTELEGEAVGDEGFAQKERGKAWNSLVVMPARDELLTFRKHHLVFFGETIPFADQIPLLRKIYEQQAGVEYGGSFSSGESLDPLPVDVRGTRVGVIPSICFEDTVGRLERKFVRPGPQLIVNVTNDGWFKDSEAAEQHFHNAIFRAIELRRPMIRCANTGVSAGVSSTGGTLAKITDANGSHFTNGSVLVELPIPLDPPFSLYALAGDWPVIGLGLAGLALGFIGRKRRMDSIPG